MNFMKSRYNPLLLAVIVIGLVCALWLNVVRHDVEQKNNTVEMAMEYEGLRKLAALQGPCRRRMYCVSLRMQASTR